MRDELGNDVMIPGSLKAVKAKFDKDFLLHPTSNLGWSRDLFKAAAEYEVAGEIISLFESGYDWDTTLAYLVNQALRAARNPGRSSSGTSNMVSEYMTEAWAAVADKSWTFG